MMEKFEPAFEETMIREGGYVLHTVAGDPGGMTYAGISRRYHPSWLGWRLVDSGDTRSEFVKDLAREFYLKEFWSKMRLDELNSQIISSSIYDFAVNAGIKVSIKASQEVINTKADGIIGPITISKLNSHREEDFIISFTLKKIIRYAGIANKSKTKRKFLLGWLNRSLKDLKVLY